MEEKKKPPVDGDTEVRRRAVLELRGKQSTAAVRLLLKAMEDSSWRVRKAASEILTTEYSLEHYVDGLIKLLSIEENAGARNSAIETLVKLGKKVTAHLVDAFDTSGRDVRKFIVDIIGEVKDKKALPLLLKALKDEDDNVKASAVEHLGQMGDRSVVGALIEILNSGDIWTAFPAADALGRIGDKKAVPALLGALNVKALREPVLKGLSHLSAPETLEYIVPFLADASRSTREETLITIGVFYHKGTPADFISETMNRLCGPEVIHKIAKHAWSPKADVRTAAILLLGLMQDERALGPLLELYTEESVVEDVKRALVFIGKGRPESLIALFDSDDEYQRRLIAEVAVEVASPVYRELFEDLLSDEDGHVRAFAAIGLSRLRDKGAVQSLKKLLSDPYEDIQEAAVTALSDLRERLDIGEFVGCLRAGDAALRRNAALLLGKIGAMDSIAALGFALKDADVSVRQAVVEALSSLKTEEAAKYLIFALTDEDPHIRASAALSLGPMEARNLDPLVLLLSDPDDSVKVAAVRAIGMTGERSEVGHLIHMLANRNGFVVTTAIESLAKLGGDEAGGAVASMLGSDDPEIRRTAIRSLSCFSGFEKAVLSFLRDPDWATRIAAVETLSRCAAGKPSEEIEELYDREEDPAVRRAMEELFGVR